GYGYRPGVGTRLLAATYPQRGRLALLDQGQHRVADAAVLVLHLGRYQQLAALDRRRPDGELGDPRPAALPRGVLLQAHAAAQRLAQKPVCAGVGLRLEVA